MQDHLLTRRVAKNWRGTLAFAPKGFEALVDGTVGCSLGLSPVPVVSGEAADVVGAAVVENKLQPRLEAFHYRQQSTLKHRRALERENSGQVEV